VVVICASGKSWQLYQRYSDFLKSHTRVRCHMCARSLVLSSLTYRHSISCCKSLRASRRATTCSLCLHSHPRSSSRTIRPSLNRTMGWRLNQRVN